MKPGQLSHSDRSISRAYRVYALTGGIASGKSTAAQFFEDIGIPVVDADPIARELSAPGGLAHRAILQRFGTAERNALRSLVFSDPVAKRDLEAILHPLIRTESQKRIAQFAETLKAENPGAIPVVLYEAALILESRQRTEQRTEQRVGQNTEQKGDAARFGEFAEFDGVIVVVAPRETRLQRLMSRQTLSEDQAERIIHSQSSDEEKRAAATYVIENFSSLEELKKQVEQVAQKIRI